MDIQAVNLAKAIRKVESGDNFNARGASGESGAYQFMPSTWRAFAAEVLGNPNARMTPQNQNAVAYVKIKEWKDAGLNAAQIAAKWNSGSEKGWERKIGRNNKGVAYNVPLYVKRVTDTYQGIKGATQQVSPIQEPNPEPEKKLIEKVGDFFGVENIGKSIAQSIFKLTPTGRELESKIKSGTANQYEREAYDQIKKDNPTFKKILGDIIQVGATVATGGIAPAAKGALGTAKLLGKVGVGGAAVGFGAGLSDDKTVGDSVKQAFTTGLTSAATVGALGAIGKLSRAALEKLPTKMYSSIAKLEGETANVLMNEKQVGSIARLKAIADNQIDDIEKTIASKIKQGDFIFEKGTKKRIVFDSKHFLRTVATKVKQEFQGANSKEISQAIRKWKIDPLLKQKNVDFATIDNLRKGIGKTLRNYWDVKEMGGGFTFNKRVGDLLWKEMVNAYRPITGTVGDFKRLESYTKAYFKLTKTLNNQQSKFGIPYKDIFLSSLGYLGGGVPGAVTAEAVKIASQSSTAKTATAVGLNEVNKLVQKIPASYFDKAGRITRAGLVKALSEANE